MANNNQSGSLDVLKKAFAEGYEAFQTVKPNAKGFMQNPSNTYPPKSLPFKEWERGFNMAYFNSQKKVVV